MPTNFPTLLDEFSNPSGADAQSSAPVLHSTQHVNANDAIEALQAKVGVDGSTDPDSLDYKIAHFDPAPSSTDAVEEGSSNLYFTYQRVCDTVLTALSTATNTAITATDTLLAALGKLQAQVTNKVDKESGKGLSANDYTDTEKTKLAGIAAGANAYTHPATHEPSIITQDANNRFVTDAEKAIWNGKLGASAIGNTVAPLVDGLVPSANLPSYVDDVIAASTFASLPTTGESGKIYVLDTPYTAGGITSSQFRWSGSVYAPIIASPGTTDAVTEGATNLYFTAARVRAVVLTGLSLATNAAISATDTILSALGKLQKQITDLAAANTGDQTLSSLGAVAAANPTTSGTLTHSGDIVLSGSGKRITGDFSNATLANRLMFQNAATDTPTHVGAIPNGLVSNSSFTAYQNSDPDNTSYLQMLASGTGLKLTAGKTGTGSYKPLALRVGGADVVIYSEAAATLGNMTASVSNASGPLTYTLSNTNAASGVGAIQFLTSNAGSLYLAKYSAASALSGGAAIYNAGGALWIGTSDTGNLNLATNSSPSAYIDSSGNLLAIKATGGLGYGAGAGGTVTQTTSRTNPTPAINFPNGDITLFTAAGSATPASFSVPNSLVGAKDVPTIAVRGATNKYITQVTNVVAGTSFEVTFWTTGGTAVDTPVFHFNLGKGS